MTANIIIVISVVLYVILLLVMYKAFSNRQFTGSDAAGNGMAKGLTFFYGLGVLFLIALVLTIVNAFFFNDISFTWIKFLFFAPILLPLLIFTITSMEIGRPKRTSIEKQIRTLTFEIRTKVKLKNPAFSLSTSEGRSHGKLNNKKIENSFYVYENEKFIFYGNKRMIYVKSDGYEKTEFNLQIPYKPKVIPFTKWETAFGINKDTQATIKLEFRYKITKVG
jgi:hypothetical protein